MNEEVSAFNQSNDGYTSAGVIQIRLDTGPMLDQIEALLRGKRISGYVEREGAMIPRFVQVGKPKMNDEGIQSVMGWLTPLLSPSTVQGNFPTYDDLNDFVSEVEMDLNEYFWTNRVDWGVEKREVSGLINSIIKVCIAFFSRLVNNKERESYGQSIVHKESSRVEQGGGLFKKWRGVV